MPRNTNRFQWFILDLFGVKGNKKPAQWRVSCTSLDLNVRESGGERGT